MRKYLSLTTLAAMTMLAVCMPLRADASNTATANATVTVVPALAITKTSDLSFGNIVPGTTQTYIDVHSDGTRVTVGGNGVLSGGTVSASSFTVTGNSGATYAITTPTASISMGSGILLANFWGNAGFTNKSGLVGTLTGGTDTVIFGGEVGPFSTVLTPPGTYTATFNISVAYN